MPTETSHVPRPSSLGPLLAAAAGDLLTTLERRLDSTAAPHYRDSHPALLHERCARLVGAFIEATVSGAPWGFAAHVRRITDERIAEGYHLSEIQLALSVLEGRAWQLAVERSSAGELVSNLAFVTGLVGQAKDELARAYLAHKEHADVRAAELQRRLDELFKGTERPAQPELVGTR